MYPISAYAEENSKLPLLNPYNLFNMKLKLNPHNPHFINISNSNPTGRNLLGNNNNIRLNGLNK